MLNEFKQFYLEAERSRMDLVKFQIMYDIAPLSVLVGENPEYLMKAIVTLSSNGTTHTAEYKLGGRSIKPDQFTSDIFESTDQLKKLTSVAYVEPQALNMHETIKVLERVWGDYCKR